MEHTTADINNSITSPAVSKPSLLYLARISTLRATLVTTTGKIHLLRWTKHKNRRKSTIFTQQSSYVALVWDNCTETLMRYGQTRYWLRLSSPPCSASWGKTGQRRNGQTLYQIRWSLQNYKLHTVRLREPWRFSMMAGVNHYPRLAHPLVVAPANACHMLQVQPPPSLHFH